MNYTLHNIADINKDNDGFFSSYRFTEDVRNSMDNDFGKTIANTVISGSEIRFVINSGKALLKIIYEGEEMYSPKVYMNFGTFQGAWIWKDSVTLKNGLNEIEVWYPENIDTLLEIEPKAESLRYKIFVDSSPVLEKPVGYFAGFGFIGSNTLVVDSEWGSYFNIGGAFAGVTILNILIYEIIAFLILVVLFGTILK